VWNSSRLPVVAFYDGTVLVDPAPAEVWRMLGVKTHLDVEFCDVVVVGAGPAGLAAAVYAASEGLETLVLEPAVPGGQAGTSSLIRNYLGFHRGVSGDELANRAVEQAWLFGTNFVLSQAATRLGTRGPMRVVTTSDGSEVAARAVIIATGVSWRRLGVPTLEALIGAGCLLWGSWGEARAVQGRDVFVVGAGNSAGQAAMHLSRYAATVTMLVRGKSLRTSMSEYLISEIEQTPNITVRLGIQVVAAAAVVVAWKPSPCGSGAARKPKCTGLRALPADRGRTRTGWLHGSVTSDDRGYLLTGRDLLSGDTNTGWPLRREPMHLETSLPGVFAAGDVRHRSTKRVAAAVGEGATAIQLVHDYLSEDDPQTK
jgi:thioredoxin reductase (NADPH)